MANVQGPFGFSPTGTASGPPNFAENHNPPYKIASGYATAIYKGDAVRMNSSGPTGYIEQWANGDGGTANHGVDPGAVVTMPTRASVQTIRPETSSGRRCSGGASGIRTPDLRIMIPSL